MQREHDKDRDTKSRRIVNISDITRIRLRRRIQKIYEMLEDVKEGYGTFYKNKHGNPLPKETVDKITGLYHNRIARRCIEVGLTVDEEREWDSDDADVDVDALSESGEESEEHSSLHPV
jgi:predicted mannosyl-3-phosphoglycerate phosphatase (HAD superfamily)